MVRLGVVECLFDTAQSVCLIFNIIYIVSSVSGLICVMLFWLLARFDRGFFPCFVPAK